MFRGKTRKGAVKQHREAVFQRVFDAYLRDETTASVVRERARKLAITGEKKEFYKQTPKSGFKVQSEAGPNSGHFETHVQGAFKVQSDTLNPEDRGSKCFEADVQGEGGSHFETSKHFETTLNPEDRTQPNSTLNFESENEGPFTQNNQGCGSGDKPPNIVAATRRTVIRRGGRIG